MSATTADLPSSVSDSEPMAAVDLGSNSFHLIIAREADGTLQMLDRMREMVQLGAGLDTDRNLTQEAQERAWSCLERFGQRLQEMHPSTVRAVGTNTLRVAHNGREFLMEAQRRLGHPVEVIAGREEARLIYLGVSHFLPADAGRCLVMDIGGGSTEFIIGERFEPSATESLHMGCVSWSRRFFEEGPLTRAVLDKAVLAASQELQSIVHDYRAIGWDSAVGASGSIRSIHEVVRANGWSEDGITLSALKKLRKAVTGVSSAAELNLPGLRPDRATIFPGGLTILLAAFESLGIEQMRVSDGALREGLLFDSVGRNHHEDVRDRTIGAMCSRYGVDEAQATRVEATALAALDQVWGAWGCGDSGPGHLLRWAAKLHEVGLAVAHSQFHKHGAYLVANADMPGFSRQEQQLLAALVRGHRRKFPAADFQALPGDYGLRLGRLCVLLRLAVLLHRSRGDAPPPAMELTADDRGLKIRFEPGWLDDHPLTHADLKQEAAWLKAAKFKLGYE